mmetsp:Transcript_19316/g.68282  ORF Transcript_19316/g.68282 Transcript_19316/m.68282 type:complete len:213 (+) Transcript_19316:1271-1909(+)
MPTAAWSARSACGGRVCRPARRRPKRRTGRAQALAGRVVAAGAAPAPRVLSMSSIPTLTTASRFACCCCASSRARWLGTAAICTRPSRRPEGDESPPRAMRSSTPTRSSRRRLRARRASFCVRWSGRSRGACSWMRGAAARATTRSTAPLTASSTTRRTWSGCSAATVARSSSTGSPCRRRPPARARASAADATASATSSSPRWASPRRGVR